jgi:Lar family restriction alleviation protein
VELLPCPFCGSKRITLVWVGGNLCAALCRGCGAEGPHVMPAGHGRSREEDYQPAAEAWNRRVPCTKSASTPENSRES